MQAAALGGIPQRSQVPGTEAAAAATEAAALRPQKEAETLLLYLYAPSDPHYRRNLEFFVEQGIRVNDGIDYVIIVQKVRAPTALCHRCTKTLVTQTLLNPGASPRTMARLRARCADGALPRLLHGPGVFGIQ